MNDATDCLLIGFNDFDFAAYVDLVRLMGEDSGAYHDLRLAFVEHDGKPYRALDVLNLFAPNFGGSLHNADFVWPVITTLGSFLAKHGFSFDFVNLFQQEKEKLRAKLSNHRYRAIAITTTLYVTPYPILEIVSFIREYNRDAKIIIGGPYVGNQVKTLSGPDLEAFFDYLGGDVYVTAQEGELTLTRVLAALREGGDLSTVPNLGYRRNDGGFALTPTEVESNALADNPTDYGLFAGEMNEFVTTRTAKSCPFSCAFCGFPQRAGKYTYLDLTHVERELDNIASVPGVSTVTFIDDTFNVPKNRFRDILRMMIDKGYNLRWNCFYRSDHGDAATIRLMREAGCEGVFLGIESGSDQMLKRMNKTARRHDYLEALGVFNEVGISTYASLIVGFPGETDGTVAETISLIEQGRPDFYRAQLWYCDPVTPIWQQRERYEITGSGFTWSHATMDSTRACEIITDMFENVRGSTWLPQFGFEQWSTFYLQRKGMPLADIKRFLGAFNAVVLDQVRHPGQDGIRPDLLDTLRVSCQPAALGRV